MNFCSKCGQSITERVPDGDNRIRHVCEHCNTIHYQNPRIIAGCLPIFEDKILLCKRAIEPRYGYWTLPAGFMENGESTGDAALRETWEEALARVELQGLYTLFDLPQINQVYIIYKALLPTPEFGAGTESLDTQLFDEADIPWDEIAFPVIKKTLEYYLEDRKNNTFPVRVESIIRKLNA